MRVLLHLLAILAVMGFAWWAYGENYRTRAVREEVARLENRIAETREEIAQLRAEWAFLNRPERLRALADLNFPFLGLVSPGADAFAPPSVIPFREEEPDGGDGRPEEPVFVAGPGRPFLIGRQLLPAGVLSGDDISGLKGEVGR